MCVQNLIKRFMSYQQCTRFRTIIDFDPKYLWNGSSNHQAEYGVINYDFLHIRRSQVGKLWSNMTLTLIFNRIRATVKVHVHANYDQAKCSGSWVIVPTNFFALCCIGKESENTVLWPITLKFSGFRAVVKVHVLAKFHQAECSGSREKTQKTKTILSIATARTVKM